jgi:hypothetical protein
VFVNSCSLTKEYSARHVPGSRLAEFTFSCHGVLTIETGKQSVLLVGRTSQQSSIPGAVRLARQPARGSLDHRAKQSSGVQCLPSWL